MRRPDPHETSSPPQSQGSEEQTRPDGSGQAPGPQHGWISRSSLLLLSAPRRGQLPRDSIFCLKLCNINTYSCVSWGMCASTGPWAPEEEADGVA